MHRAALSEVFLTGWEPDGEDQFRVTAQWPRCHSFYESEHGVYDPMLLCETIRQTFPLLTHAAYGVPFGHQLSWVDLQYSLNPHAMGIGRAPAEVELRVACSDLRYRQGLPASMRMAIEVIRGGELLAVATTRFNVLTPVLYRRLRGPARDTASVFAEVAPPPAPISRHHAGRSRSYDIVLSPARGAGRWQLRSDTTHPVLFDHPVDHVPGMLLLESVRQAASALEPAAGPILPSSMDVAFHRYVEFDSPCWIEARSVPAIAAGAARGVQLTGVQNGQVTFTATSEVTTL
ncbi:transcriptional regulator [Streptomyces sp. G44]|nr:transcriptional regulator [Streptomyces sp. G44]